MDKVITISREFGSGGRELGVKLADKLGIPFYDKELISMAADDINIAEDAFQHYDEHIVVHDPLDRQFYHAFSEVYQIPMSDQIFVAQSNVIRRLASYGTLHHRRAVCGYDTDRQSEPVHLCQNER